MSEFTTELRFICETLAGYEESQGYDKVDEVIAESRPKLFDFSYPIFDEAYRPVLEKKIIMHYYTREIAAETVGLWKLWLNRKLNEIMPYYNQLYESETYKYNPLYDIDLSNHHILSHIGKTDGTNGNLNGSTDYELYSDTPQGALDGVEAQEYLTNATKNTHTGSSNDTYHSDVNNTDQYVERVNGSSGGTSYASKMAEYRKNLINIDAMIIEELAVLFFNLW